jgi:hypothetical protein
VPRLVPAPGAAVVPAPGAAVGSCPLHLAPRLVPAPGATVGSCTWCCRWFLHLVLRLLLICSSSTLVPSTVVLLNLMLTSVFPVVVCLFPNLCI